MDYEPPAMHQGVFFVHEVRIGGVCLVSPQARRGFAGAWLLKCKGLRVWGGLWDVRSGKWLIANADNNFIVRVAAQILYFRVNYKKPPHGHL